MNKVRYSVYRAKDEMPIVIAGTIEECAEALGIKVKSFKEAASRQRHGSRPVGNRKRSFIIIRDGKLEDED